MSRGSTPRRLETWVLLCYLMLKLRGILRSSAILGSDSPQKEGITATLKVISASTKVILATGVVITATLNVISASTKVTLASNKLVSATEKNI